MIAPNLAARPFLNTRPVWLVTGVAAALAVSPPVGAAVLVAQQLLGKELDKMTQYRYEVVGPWEEPTINFVRLGSNRASGAGFLDASDQ